MRNQRAGTEYIWGVGGSRDCGGRIEIGRAPRNVSAPPFVTQSSAWPPSFLVAELPTIIDIRGFQSLLAILIEEFTTLRW